MRILRLVPAVILVAGSLGLVQAAQFNPIQAAKDAYNKAKQQQQQPQQQKPQGQQQPQPQQQTQQPAQPQQPANTPANSSAPAAAPVPAAAPAGAPAADPALASWSTADPFVPDGGRGGGNAGGGTLAVAPSGATPAPNAPPDFAKLPDIGGFLRVGLTIDQSRDAITKMHQGAASTNIVNVSRDGKPPLQALKGQFGDESIFFYYTLPPNGPQTAYAVERTVPYPGVGIDRQKLIDALRQKYGHETKTLGDNGNTIMWWVYDEQGHFIASDNGGSRDVDPPFLCGNADNYRIASGPVLNTWPDLQNQIRLNQLPPPKYCDTIVEMMVLLDKAPSGPANVGHSYTVIYDPILLRRDAVAAGAVANGKAQQQQQQQLDQSKHAKPSL